jgi:hypothetical protein
MSTPRNPLDVLLDIDDKLAALGAQLQRGIPTGTVEAADFARFESLRGQVSADIARILENQIDLVQTDLGSAIGKLAPLNLRLAKALADQATASACLDIVGQVLDVSSQVVGYLVTAL